MAGRTVNKWARVYMDGRNISGYGRTIGPLAWTSETADLTVTMSDAIKGGLPNHVTVGFGTFEGVFDNTATTGLHALFGTPGSARDVMVAIGDRAAPAIGVPTFCGCPIQTDYQTHEEGGAMVVTIPFELWNPPDLLNFHKPWGLLAHDLSAETAVNSGTTDSVDHGAQTTAGGWCMWQVTTAAGAGDMTATFKIQHSNTNVDGDFADLLAATSGVINCSGGGVSGIAQTAVTETVERYTRWQIVLGTATSVTFALSFIRA